MSNAGKTALVTGGCGFSAGFTMQKLLDDGWKVVTTDLKSASKARLEKFGDKIKYIPADLTDKNSLKPTVKDVDVIFHPAAVFNYSAPMELLRAVNVEGTKNLIDVAMDAGVKKIVIWSSVAIYGTADPKFYEIPIKEDTELNPKCEGCYDSSKREQEAAALTYFKENKFPISIIRPGPMYGPGSYYGIYTLFKYVQQASLPVLPRNFHKLSIPLVHVSDVANSTVFLSDEKKFNGEIYNLCDDNSLDFVQTLKFIAENTGGKFKIIIPTPLALFKLIKPFIKIFGMWSLWESKKLRKKVDGRHQTPKLETDTLAYLYGKFNFSNEKLKQVGYTFLYPDRRFGLLELIKWYDEYGWKTPNIAY